MQSEFAAEVVSSEFAVESASLMRLSQGQLNLLQTCPRKFQQIYLDQLSSPPTPEQQIRQAWGSQFHLLMQQRELGLPIEALVQEDAQLQRCFAAFMQVAPDILTTVGDREAVVLRESEHRRTMSLDGFLLTVIYDLLILETDQAQIFDWKTYPRPQSVDRLAQDWQTRLYPFVLTETSEYQPEQISMTYWFVQAQDEPTQTLRPQALTFTYSEALHQQNWQALTQLLSQLHQWLDRYQAGEPFPQVAPNSSECGSCHFSGRCQRSQATAIVDHWLPDLDLIQEVVL